MEEQGRVHLYWGDGKGKTTAAMGLALRALGNGMSVTVVQFLKGSSTGEVHLLKQLGAKVYRGKAGQKFVFQMNEDEKKQTAYLQTQNLRLALSSPCDLLVLDEACAAWQLDMIDKELLQQAVLQRPNRQEVVLTGREPAQWMQQAADYSTEMRCHRHPYEQGVTARRGIEF
ncbi:cob(I)yrinic acid a,c-diamide adenosyltransferase [uncultured Ruthenibacterium sp.]|uniref:cob(I)yrinic acid a,c-diamide adenosyltransferase n=1 Tax=uncultured Ruthenibacterium sp. TaxID=1905347 RepID=UPI00349EB42F